MSLAVWMLYCFLACKSPQFNNSENLENGRPFSERALIQCQESGNCPPNRVFGRILKGKVGGDFDYLSSDLSRKIVFLLDIEGLRKISNVSDFEKLRIIGYPDSYINELLKSGHGFRLVVFCGDDSIAEATWDNLALMFDRDYSKDFPELNRLFCANVDGFKRRYSGRLPKQVFEELKQERGDAWKIRGHLARALNVNANFSGDGFSRSPKGERQVREFIGRNGKLSELDLIDVFSLYPVLPSK